MMFGVRKLYKETEERVKLRWKFEEGVKRPYFHVKVTLDAREYNVQVCRQEAVLPRQGNAGRQGI